MTVTHMYSVDELVDLTPHLNATSPYGPRRPDSQQLWISPALHKVALVGSLCNDAFKNDQGINVGQATEVALLNVLPVLKSEDQRKVGSFSTFAFCIYFADTHPPRLELCQEIRDTVQFGNKDNVSYRIPQQCFRHDLSQRRR